MQPPSGTIIAASAPGPLFELRLEAAEGTARVPYHAIVARQNVMWPALRETRMATCVRKLLFSMSC